MQENITVSGGNPGPQEVEGYIRYVTEKNPGRALKSLNIHLDGDYANLKYEFEPVPFERIRRITGYLVGSMDRWNDAKRAEERDRVKHGM